MIIYKLDTLYLAQLVIMYKLDTRNSCRLCLAQLVIVYKLDTKNNYPNKKGKEKNNLRENP